MSATAHAAHVLDATGIGALLRRLDLWDGVLTLAFHRIGDPDASSFDRALWSATADGFDEQLRVLAAESDVIGLDDLERVRRHGRGRHVLLTFDDGYRDNHDVAFPLLARHGLTAAFFLATSFLDHPRAAWWDEAAWMLRTTTRDRLDLPGRLPEPLAIDRHDREPAIRRLVRACQALPSARAGDLLAAAGDALGVGRCPRDLARETWMTWEMAREMRDAGMSFGGHTASHPVLARESAARQRGEVLGCRRRLAEELSLPMTAFSYPIGGRDAFDHDTRRCLAEAGVEVAFSSYGGVGSFARWDPYDVPRATLAPGACGAAVRAAILHPRAFARW